MGVTIMPTTRIDDIRMFEAALDFLAVSPEIGKQVRINYFPTSKADPGIGLR
jgi:hypothetical protein